MSLLDLPVEILRLILEDVVLATRAPPASIDEAGRSRHATPRWTDRYDCALSVCVEEGVLPPNNIGLLSSCKPLGEVTQSVIKDLQRQNRIVFTADVLMVGERELWPTWTCVPVATSSIDRLEVTVRVADGHRTVTYDRLIDAKIVTYAHSSGMAHGAGGPPALMWAFHYLLQSFLQSGISLDVPQSTYTWQSARDDRQLIVRSLYINITTIEGAVLPPPEVDYDAWQDARQHVQELTASSTPELVPNLLQYCMRPVWLADFLSRGLYAMTDATYGTLLVGRVGKMEICADGEQRDPRDLGEWLTTFRNGQYAQWDQKRESVKSRWRARLRERHAAGLSLGSAAQWLEEANQETVRFA